MVDSSSEMTSISLWVSESRPAQLARMVVVGYPHDGLDEDVVEPYANVPIAGVGGAEEAYLELFACGEQAEGTAFVVDERLLTAAEIVTTRNKNLKATSEDCKATTEDCKATTENWKAFAEYQEKKFAEIRKEIADIRKEIEEEKKRARRSASQQNEKAMNKRFVKVMAVLALLAFDIAKLQ
ncbi:hypothetical protein ZIOFF_034525 [Zingiber officinale]|uniref:Uncharacterized protein n=1 Tax=Zingiber officinale TaxID=94328 RepID=A0A8J5L2J4_ZINOF|nr:hypothetical protein ZIOFF_034525 [Zingiber officinale]